MSDLKEFADQLQEEVVSDMAEAYFGERKDLEELIEAYGRMTEDVRALGPRLFEAVARLHRLLLDRETAEAFYAALGVDPAAMPFPDDPPRPFFDRLPFAFTAQGRYERCVFRVYDLLHQEADVYLNGRYFVDPEQGKRKRLTPHYVRVKALADHLNAEIDKINRRSVTGALQYVKNMDPDHARQERLMGDTDSQGETLNHDMEFVPIDFAGIGLPVVPELPPLYKVKEKIKAFCGRVWALRREEAVRAMESLLER